MPKSLNTKIAQAQARLNDVFGDQEPSEGDDANRFLNEKTLAEAYKLDASTSDVIKQFVDITKTIRNMRSSYLPVTFFIDRDVENRFSVDVANEFANIEPYENTFMRMLGMPSVGTSEFAKNSQDNEIRKSTEMTVVDPVTGLPYKATFAEVERTILRERKVKKDSRRIVIDTNIYNIQEDNIALLGRNIRVLSNFQRATLLGLPYDEENDIVLNTDGSPLTIEVEIITLNEEETGYINPVTGTIIDKDFVDLIFSQIDASGFSAKIDAIEDDLWKFSYLLIPPIQDIEIASAINEPSKMVAPPFSNPRVRKVNNNEVKPTLLESVIRIRLDKVSGTDTIFEDSSAGRRGVFRELVGTSDVSTEINTDSYGVLESLFILRLRSAIKGLAYKMYNDIDNIIDELEKTKKKFVQNDQIYKTKISYEQENESLSSPMDNREQRVLNLSNLSKGKVNDIKESSINEQRLIEDSIMFLLADNSEALDLQSQTQRNSGIKNSHMMGGLVNIIDVPRKRLIEQERQLKVSRESLSGIQIDGLAQSINTVLGVDIGIGTIDVAVFSLALFTISENSLLGLLSKEQFEKIKSGEFSGLLPADATKKDAAEAIEELTQLIIDGYNLFISDLKNEEPLT